MTTIPSADETSAIIAGLQAVRSRAPDVTHKAIERAIEHLAAQEARIRQQAAELEQLRREKAL